MRISKAQARAIVEQLARLEIDDRLRVTVIEDPRMDAPRGVLRLSLIDRWGREVLRVDRQGHVAPPPLEHPRPIPGQLSLLG